MTNFSDIFDQLHLGVYLRAIVLIAIGYFIARLLSMSLTKALRKRLTPQQSMLSHRILFYLIFILFLASAIQQLGFHISALLGATGIITIAIGIASQTSLSNIISGIFMISEKTFQIGDTIKINELQGNVLSIDLLSVRIRTSDNTMIRIPNEILIKSPISNISYFPVRRCDLIISIAYNEEIERVKHILFAIAEKNIFALPDPPPSFVIAGMENGAVRIQFSVWTNKDNFEELKTTLQTEIKNTFLEHKIDMPFLPRSFYRSQVDPLSVKIIS
ncbi:hypothetical protein AYO45_02770 [Gammaproteobacteria bacterium SCGC AG-212-F23]|nr:hypothetical protein AYO45_02770 [Gammaproteobacteria bacterium SCGC AG-212-F23]